MKKVLFALLFVLVGAGYAFAAATGEVHIHCRVIQALQVIVDSNYATIEFGDVVQGDSATVTPGDATSASVEVVGSNLLGVTIMFTAVGDLTTPITSVDISDGTNTLTVNLSDNQGIVSNGGQISLSAGSWSPFYFRIGGDVTVPETQAPGDYYGSFWVVANYQ